MEDPTLIVCGDRDLRRLDSVHQRFFAMIVGAIACSSSRWLLRFSPMEWRPWLLLASPISYRTRRYGWRRIRWMSAPVEADCADRMELG